MTNSSRNLVLFASGGGSNAFRIMQYFENHPIIKVAAVICNNEHAGIIEKAKQFNIPCDIISKQNLKDKDYMQSILEKFSADYLILAGFLLLIPAYLIKLYKDKIINIHPSLLPKYGGKGMYGLHIHKAVLAAKEPTTGITIHLVNEEYDRGRILLQESMKIVTNDAEELAGEVLKMEHKHFSPVIEKYILASN